MGSFSPLFAVHISDGVLTAPWLAGGFAVAAVLALLGSWRIREWEIPRIALLTAAFFVASLLHLRLGPTSVHLLLNGLVGVILGWRAALAIPVGLFLQAALIGHGGISTLGVNACVMTIPALLASAFYRLVERTPSLRLPGLRATCVALGTALLAMAVVCGVIAVFLYRRTDLEASLFEATLRRALHPVILISAAILGIIAARLERRLEHAPEFAVGLMVGAGAVVATALLNATVLLLGGVEKWDSLVVFVLLAHLPLAVLEGVVVGFTVCFLARVKPELLTGAEAAWQPSFPAPRHDGIAVPPAIQPGRNGHVQESDSSPAPSKIPFLLAALTVLSLAPPALAHRLNGEYRVLPKEHKVKVESWFEGNETPQNATVQVFRSDQRLLTEGKLNENGVFVFSYEEPDALRIVILAPGGHRKDLTITKKELEGAQDGKTAAADDTSTTGADAGDNEKSFADRSSRTSIKDVLLGVSVLLAIAGFVLGVLNARALRDMKRNTL